MRGFCFEFVASGAPPVLSISDHEKPRRLARHRSFFYIHLRAEELCSQRITGHVGRLAQQLEVHGGLMDVLPQQLSGDWIYKLSTKEGKVGEVGTAVLQVGKLGQSSTATLIPVSGDSGLLGGAFDWAVNVDAFRFSRFDG